MNAFETHRKLQADLAERERRIASLQAERTKLALPAHTGDEAAMLRLQDIRVDIDRLFAERGTLEQAIQDMEPHLAVERAEAHLEARLGLLGEYEQAQAVLAKRAAVVDKAVEALAVAVHALRPEMERVARLYPDLIAPVTAASNISDVAVDRMNAASVMNMRPMTELLEQALRERDVLFRRFGTSQPPLKLRDHFEEKAATLRARIDEKIEVDRRTAAGVRAAALPEPAA